MAKVEITLTSNYVSGWGSWEGIRELIQNARDGEVEHGAKMTVNLTDAGNLVIKNRGVTLPREALLIGFTTKENNDRAIGQFGEGLKLGILALCRVGYKIRIHNGSEIWKPSIAKSEKYNAEVLCFDITRSKARDTAEDLTVIVEGVGDYWDEIKGRFLFLNKNVEKVEADHYHGELILDDDKKGMLYVKGIFVEQEDLEHGYNFYCAKTDRDRQMVNNWDKRWHMSHILSHAAQKKSAIQGALVGRVLDMLERGSEEVGCMSSAISNNSDFAYRLSTKFKERYGDKAIPVSSVDESRQLEAAGKLGIVLPAVAVDALEPLTASFSMTMEEARKTPMKMWSWHELTDEQKENVDTVTAMLVQTGVPAPTMNIVTFMDERTMGKCVKGEILISHTILDDLPELLHTYVHEWAHLGGAGDVDLSHRELMGKKLAEIAVNNHKEGK